MSGPRLTLLAVVLLAGAIAVALAMRGGERAQWQAELQGEWEFFDEAAASDARASWDREGIRGESRSKLEASLQRYLDLRVIPFQVRFEPNGKAAWRSALPGQPWIEGRWSPARGPGVRLKFPDVLPNAPSGTVKPPGELALRWHRGLLWALAEGLDLPLRRRP